MQIDCHGYKVTDRGYMYWRPRPYKIKVVDNVTYVCFTNASLRCIHRISTVDGETTVDWAFGDWDHASELAYIPINQPREVRNGRIL